MDTDAQSDDPFDPDDPIDQTGGNRRGGGLNRTLVVAGVVVVGLIAIALVTTSGGGGTAATVVACAPSAGAADPSLIQGLQPEPEPDALPAATLCAFDGDEGVDTDGWLGGRPLVINFWATWCAPCVAEMPEFQQIHEAGQADFRLIGINTQDAPPLARGFVEELGITYDLVRDPNGDYFNANNGFGMPTTLFVAPDGDIRYRHTGPLTLEQMAELLAEHLDVRVEA